MLEIQIWHRKNENNTRRAEGTFFQRARSSRDLTRLPYSKPLESHLLFGECNPCRKVTDLAKFLSRRCKASDLLQNVVDSNAPWLSIHNAKAGYTLIVSTCSCTILWTISWDCKPITIHFSQYRRFRSPLILRETLQETCLIVLFDISWKYRSSGENGKTRDEKNDWRDGLWNAIYTLIISLISPTFFRVLVNLTISV